MRASLKILIAALGGLCAAIFVVGPTIADEPGAGSEPGVWRKHDYSFDFMGFTSTYSCDGLADQLQRLLLASGARADAKAQAGACANGFGRPDRFARASLAFYTLAPSTAGGAAGDRGVGHWRPVALSAHSPSELRTGDCELVEQFRDSVLVKMFTIRNLVDHTTCVPHQESGSTIDLRFEVFEQAPAVPVAASSSPVAAKVFAYPKQGQNAAQQEKDRSECAASAAMRSGAGARAADSEPNAPPGDAYARALATCLEGRGYSVR